jgi:hypothetical protein
LRSDHFHRPRGIENFALYFVVPDTMAPIKFLLAIGLGALVSPNFAAYVPFELDLTWQKGAPNGNTRDMIFMNGQFPGPHLVVDQGDDVGVRVYHNSYLSTKEKR